MEKITAAGGILFKSSKEIREPLVLLIYRRGCWDLPKGKKEDSESVEMCAAREVSEEIGIPIPGIIRQISDSYHEYDREGVHFAKTTHWFVMHTSERRFIPQKEEQIEKIEWFPVSRAKEMIGYKNLLPVLERFEKWYNSRFNDQITVDSDIRKG
jgi:8-oxo-dGTP pyrophosphatase MutT (NUDIX family)